MFEQDGVRPRTAKERLRLLHEPPTSPRQLRRGEERPLFRVIAPSLRPVPEKGQVPGHLVAAVRGRTMTPEELGKRSLSALGGRWKRLAPAPATQADFGPRAVVVGLCRLCVARKLPPLVIGYSTTAGYLADWHGSCLSEWRRTPGMRRWVADRRASNPYPMPLPPEPPDDERKDLVLLKRDLRFAVLNRLRELGVAGGRSQPQLAAEAGISQPTVHQRIGDVLRLLPAHEKAPERFRPLLRLLRRSGL
jgi:hypothetical protein